MWNVASIIVIVFVSSVAVMNLFYLDTEYSHGNFYLGDIFDVTLIAAKSGHVFHTLITIPTSLDNYVKFMCNMTDATLQTEGIDFRDAFTAMIRFVNCEVEEEDKEEVVTIIAHSGFLTDFPLLVANCIKNKCDTTAMDKYRFVDTLQLLQKEVEQQTHNTSISLGICLQAPQSLSLKSLAKHVLGIDIHQPVHTSHNDADILMRIFEHEPYKSILMDNINNQAYTLNAIQEYLNVKMPLPITTMYTLAARTKSPDQLSLLLSGHLREKTALNKRCIADIARYYYYLCF